MSTAIATALDSLVTYLRGQDVAVLDGPPGAATLPRKAVLMVGVSAGDRSGAVVTRTNDGLGMRPTQAVSVQCVAACGLGEADVASARRSALGLAQQVDDIIAADRTLGGTVALAEVGNSELVQTNGPRGAAADVLLDVVIHVLE